MTVYPPVDPEELDAARRVLSAEKDHVYAAETALAKLERQQAIFECQDTPVVRLLRQGATITECWAADGNYAPFRIDGREIYISDPEYDQLVASLNCPLIAWFPYINERDRTVKLAHLVGPLHQQP